MDAEALYGRSVATLLASWELYARHSAGGRLLRRAGAAAAIFPSEPERSVYNNALLDRRLAEPQTTVAALEREYAAAGVERFAVWAHEDDPGASAALKCRGYVFDSATRAMGMALDEIPLARPQLDLGPLSWAEYLRIFGLPEDLLGGGDPELRLLVAREGEEPVATALTFDHGGDCGVFNVATREHARRRGIGTALVAAVLHAACERGCTTATLQSTPMAERVYAAAGFRDLGRYLEYVPG